MRGWTRTRGFPLRIDINLWPVRAVIPFLCLCLCLIPSVARAQNQLEEIERLYTAAAYEEALALLDKLEPVLVADKPRAAETRILCLLAIGQTERAEVVIEGLLEKIPRYQPNPARFSPGRRELFESVRRRVLPRIIEARYAAAKASFEAKDYKPAVIQFETVLDLLSDAEDQPRFSEVRTLASGFLDIAKGGGAPAQSPVGTTGSTAPDSRVASVTSDKQENPSTVGRSQPSRSPQNTSPRSEHEIVYDTAAADVVPPTPLKPILPPASVPASVPSPNAGLFEVIIDESGRVESASVKRSIHPQYDAIVLSESRNWRFKPAIRDGRPVKFRKLIEIYAAPIASIRQ